MASHAEDVWRSVLLCKVSRERLANTTPSLGSPSLAGVVSTLAGEQILTANSLGHKQMKTEELICYQSALGTAGQLTCLVFYRKVRTGNTKALSLNQTHFSLSSARLGKGAPGDCQAAASGHSWHTLGWEHCARRAIPALQDFHHRCLTRARVSRGRGAAAVLHSQGLRECQLGLVSTRWGELGSASSCSAPRLAAGSLWCHS